MEYAQLGDVVFQVLSYLEHSEENTYEWKEINTAIAPSVLQFFGTELSKIALKVQFHREFCNPREEYRKLKDLANRGEPAKLIVASQIIGDYVVKAIKAQYEQIDAWGKPVQLSAELELQEFIQKELQTRKIKTEGPMTVKRQQAQKLKVSAYDWRKRKVEDKEVRVAQKVS